MLIIHQRLESHGSCVHNFDLALNELDDCIFLLFVVPNLGVCEGLIIIIECWTITLRIAHFGLLIAETSVMWPCSLELSTLPDRSCFCGTLYTAGVI